jgi:uncharacterized protein YecE (DUF72 family)
VIIEGAALVEQRNDRARVRVGIGGWVFPPWRSTFYPAGLKQAEELAHASRHVTAIEINGTFYRLQTPASYRRWHDQTPDDFVFSLKGSRFITQRSDLSTAAPFMERFFDSGMAELGPKLGPILWQFMPSLPFEEANVAAFLEALPKRLGGRPLRHVFEVRHASFADPAFLALLRRHEVAVACVDDAKYPAIDELTTDFVYARLRRCAADEPAGYPTEALAAFATRFEEHAEAGRNCFVYFINGAKVRAPAAAQALIARLRG